MEYYPQDSALLNVARERLDASVGALNQLSRERHRQLATVLSACSSDTQMFITLSDLLYACEKRAAMTSAKACFSDEEHSILVAAVQTLIGPSD